MVVEGVEYEGLSSVAGGLNPPLPVTRSGIGSAGNTPSEASSMSVAPEYHSGRVRINATQYFANVPADAWNFYIGGYQPAQKWLKDRKGRTLSFDDIEHYRRIITAIMAFSGNPNDGKTIEPLLRQMEDNHQTLPKRMAYDRGGRGAKEIKGVQIILPGKPKATDTPYEKAKKRYPFRRRAGIEPHFGHLKSDYRMQENYLWGRASSTINAMLAATAWNLMKMMRKLKHLCADFWLTIIYRLRQPMLIAVRT